MSSYKNTIVLLCKTFSRDINRFSVLFDSVQKYNVDKVPLYIIIPRQEDELFRSRFGESIHIVHEDTLISADVGQSHLTQQLYKMQFCMTDIAEYCLIIDSDMYFIRDFHITDFIASDGTPYVTMHENKMLRELTTNVTGDNKLNEWFDGERKPIQDIFGREGKSLDYSGSAILYISDVFKTLYAEYCLPNNVNFFDLLKACSSENTWYGEWLLHKGYKFYPCEPMFKTFHYPFQYQLHKKLGHTEDMFAKIYLGITMQSSWGAPLKYE